MDAKAELEFIAADLDQLASLVSVEAAELAARVADRLVRALDALDEGPDDGPIVEGQAD
ncbi:MAG: hypothetical protein ACT4OP_10180 [Actinomycetota bacterium]